MDGYLAVPASGMAFSDVLVALLMYFADEKKDYSPGRASAQEVCNLRATSRLPVAAVGYFQVWPVF
jgi:hypothetical protein